MNAAVSFRGEPVCAVSEIPDGGAREVDLVRGPSRLPLILIRLEQQIKAYVNRCPHFSIPLNFEPNQFCIYDREVLMCAHHSAMFRLSDGYCFDGPCRGASLEAIQVTVDKGMVLIGGR